MKLVSVFAILSALNFLVSHASAASDAIPFGTYEIDPMHSKVGFEVSNLVISSVEGKFNSFEGQIKLEPDFKKSSVRVSVQIDSVDTGVKKRDDHLRSEDFFDVQKYSTMRFEGSNVGGNRDKFVLEGKLTLHGVTKSVKLTGKFQGSVKDAQGKERVAFVASTRISRKSFGLTWNDTVEAGPVVGDEISIEIKVQAVKVTGDDKK